MEKFRLPDEFIAELQKAVKSGPRNSVTGRKEVMVTIFSTKHIDLALNLLCSEMKAGVPQTFHLFIALDEYAYKTMKAVNWQTLFMNITGRGYEYHEFCRMKLFVQRTLVSWNVEVTSCDSDIVFLKDPRVLFGHDSEFEFQAEVPKVVFDEQYRWSRVNFGFCRVIPSELSLLLYQRWIRECMRYPHYLDQTLLSRMLWTCPLYVRNMSGGLISYNVRPILGRNQNITFRVYDPMVIASGCMSTYNGKGVINRAHKSGIEAPRLFHLACVREYRKRGYFKEGGMWYLNSDNVSCSAVMPNITCFGKWRKGVEKE
jgi:hypothetical protein